MGWVQVGKHSQQTYVTGKFVTKPVSYMAALHFVQNKIGCQTTVPMAAVAWTSLFATTIAVILRWLLERGRGVRPKNEG